eukprot:scaffold306388_cov26-Prasinocladus_malaysianus.AAC.1
MRTACGPKLRIETSNAFARGGLLDIIIEAGLKNSPVLLVNNDTWYDKSIRCGMIAGVSCIHNKSGTMCKV